MKIALALLFATCMFGSAPVAADAFEGDYISADSSVAAHFKIFSPGETYGGDYRVTGVLGNIEGDPIIGMVPNIYSPEPTVDPDLPVWFYTNARYGVGDATGFNFAVVGQSGTHYIFFRIPGPSLPNSATLFSGSGGVLRSKTSGTFNFTASPDPEPASWAMMLVGFGMVGRALRTRRKSAVSSAKPSNPIASGRF